MKTRAAALVNLLLVVAILVSVVPQAGGAVMFPGCADASHPGGEWRSYGHDQSNTRSQPLENTIDPSNAASLTPKWVFNTNALPQNGGAFQNTVVIADGCLYGATSTGWVFALNPDTGNLIWSRFFTGSSTTLIGGVIVGSVAVENGMVFAAVSQPGSPYVAAMDQATGQVLWRSTVVTTNQFRAVFNAAPVYFNGLIFQGWLGQEGSGPVRGGFAILDASRQCSSLLEVACNNPVAGATGGAVLERRWTITDEEYADGYHGASVWCTAAFDPAERYIYACGGNPHSEGKEARLANSLLKIDGDPSRPTFGDVVDYYKGRTDQYIAGADRQPICENFAGPTTVIVWSYGCLMLDLDFGASPNLFRDDAGRLLVGDLQKAGIYHAAFADHMTPAWQTIVSVPCFGCNATSGAYANGRVFTVGSPIGQVVAIEASGNREGQPQWVHPLGDGIHYQSVSTANGVVYVIDGAGNLAVVDAALGVPIMRRPITMDTGGAAADPASQGVAIARNRVYAATSRFIVSYGLP